VGLREHSPALRRAAWGFVIALAVACAIVEIIG